MLVSDPLLLCVRFFSLGTMLRPERMAQPLPHEIAADVAAAPHGPHRPARPAFRRGAGISPRDAGFAPCRRPSAWQLDSFECAEMRMDVFLECVSDPKERRRYRTLKETLEPLRPLFAGKRVLDFGASHGPAVCALLEMGAAQVVGVEPGAEWVRAGERILAEGGFGARAALLHVADTRTLPFVDASFDFVLVNAVLEHIPQPRAAYIREIWRVLRPGGFLMVNETPNKYLPRDVHTTGLWWVPWLPKPVARRYAVSRGRFPADEDWDSSGWRGLGYRELVSALAGSYTLLPERVRPRHRVLARLGLPASILDPYPNWLIRKGGAAGPAPTRAPAPRVHSGAGVE